MIVEEAQEEGCFKPEIEARFAAMAFYGVIEQLLTGWIFDLLPQGERGVRARQVDASRRTSSTRSAEAVSETARAELRWDHHGQ